MKMLIAGSRNIDNFDLSEYVSSDIELIITGGAKGIDSLAERFADEHKISKLVLYPRYNLYKRGAPLKRNELMVDIADIVLVIWDGRSSGSRYTINYAKKQNKKLIVINV